VHPNSVVVEGGEEPIPTYSHVGYDYLGRKVWESNPVIEESAGDVNDSDIKIYQYDAAGRLITVVLPEVNDPENGGQPASPVYDYYYDDYGNLIGILDAKDRLTVFKYNELGQQTAKYQPFELTEPNRVTLDVYYELSQQSPQSKAATQQYDVLGRITKATDYKGQVTGFTYNDRGLLEFEEYYVDDANYAINNPENVIEYTYDNLGRKIEVIVDNTVEQEFYYDAEGRIQVVSSPQDYIRYEYSDITGNKIETRSYSLSADLQNDVLAASDNDNTRVEYTYDILGRLWETVVIKRDGEELTTAEVTTNFYNAVGSRDLQILPNDVNTIYEYDSLNRLTNISHMDTSQQVLSSFGYSITADGMRKAVCEQVKQPDSSVENHYITYTYDNLNRLTQEQNYDNEQPLSGNGYTAEYVYDLAGNRLQRTITVNGQSPSLTTTYDYNDSTDRLDTEVHVGPVFGMELDGKRYYAYAQMGGGYKYKTAGSNKNIGSIAAYWLGLPSVWAKYIFYAVLILIPVVFFVPVIIRFYRRMGNSDSEDEPAVIRLSLYKRCLCVLLSYMMLLTPGFLESLAEGAIGYNEIDTCHWSEGNTTIDYTYDDNGSVTSKITTVTSTQSEIEQVVYEYNLQNRLNKVKTSTDGGSTWDSITEYKYNPDGIRVQKIVDSTVVTDYLIDSYNHTGYAQVLEETTDDGETVETITYTISDDVITQSDGTDIEHLLYDGHGSTRQLIEPDLTVVDTFSYDAYGVMLGGNPTSTSPAATNLLYAGEQWDNDSQNYYLRARYYNPLNGLFNRTDPFSGNLQDPQSLHKYLYSHNNPVNYIDPTGNFTTILGAVSALSIQSVMYSIIGIALGDAFTGGKICAGLSSFFSAIISPGLWASAALGVVSSFAGLIINAKALLKMVAISILSYIFGIVNIAMTLWNSLKTSGMIGDIVNSGLSPHEIGSVVAFLVATIIIVAVVSFAIGAAIKAAGKGLGGIRGNKIRGDRARNYVAAREGTRNIEPSLTVTGGVRRIDVVTDGPLKLGIETKVGRTYLTEDVRRQLARDIKLTHTGDLQRIRWEFFESSVTGQGGPSGPLLEKLRKLGINVKIHNMSF